MDMDVSMFRSDLEGIPQYVLPDGYVMRPYQMGDIQHWLDFHIPLFEEGYITEDLFREEYGYDDAEITRRQFYMMHGDIVMGSISAWFGDDERGRDIGRVHWVVIAPAYQGKGLAKPLMSFVLNKFRELGHTQAYLTTHTALIPAINLYLKFGFAPEIETAEDQQAWDGVLKQLGR